MSNRTVAPSPLDVRAALMADAQDRARTAPATAAEAAAADAAIAAIEAGLSVPPAPAAGPQYRPVYNPAGTGGYDIVDRTTGAGPDGRWHWFGSLHFAELACVALNAGKRCPSMADLCEPVAAPPAPFVALGTAAAAVVASAVVLMPARASAAPWAPDLFRDGDAIGNAAIGGGMVALYAFGAAAVLAGCAAAATAFGEGVRPPLPSLQVRAPRLSALPWPKLPAVSFKRVGGLRFVKVGRLSVSWSLARRAPVSPLPSPLAQAWSRFRLHPASTLALAAIGGVIVGTACGCLAYFAV